MAVSFNLPEGSTLGTLDLYKRFQVELRHFFQINARNPNSVDDLMQEMFLALLQGNPSGELRNAQAYLFQVAWNVLNGMNRRARREPQHMVPLDSPEFEGHAERSRGLWVEDDSSSSLAEARWEAVLEKLPPLWQTAVLRHYRDGKTCQEVADEIGCSRAAVKKYVAKALNEFRIHFTSNDAN